MDRGAARSKKRATKAQAPVQAPTTTSQVGQAGPSNPNPKFNAKSKSNSQSQDEAREGIRTAQDGSATSRFKRKERPDRDRQSKDPSLYVPKAIRTSAALIYSQSPFPIPPTSEVLASVRRLDLSGSGVTDVKWLKGTGVTWLSLNGCQIQEGWEEVGELQELTVLNINGCGIKSLPKSLGKLSKVKAIVAMNNDWTQLDEEVVSGWKDLNSLIISHSPNLTTLPQTLAELYHLSKLTFSHCPKVTSNSLPDLTNLPLLRDVKMNNLPQLTNLPKHITTWGKGNLNLVGKGSEDNVKFGDGLEVLDLGNCSLPFDVFSSIFGLDPIQQTGGKTKKGGVVWRQLRSLSIHSNPLTTTNPNYTEVLQSNSEILPNLQIIDAKRVVERKRKGELQESKIDRRRREKKERQMKPSGTNESGKHVKMRSWGDKQGQSNGDAASGADGIDVETSEKEGNAVKQVEKKDQKEHRDKSDGKRKTRDREEKAEITKKRRHNDQAPTASTDSAKPGEERKHKKQRRASPPPSTVKPQDAAVTTTAPATSGAKDITDSKRISKLDEEKESKSRDRDKSGKLRDAVVGLIEINEAGEEVEMNSKKKKKLKAKLKKNEEVKGGIDLREVFGKSSAHNESAVATIDKDEKADRQEEDGLGLGLGGW
ncbi:uncharacterized protein I303_107763 [Kwoniella dejecticola CBS 10117]|uniref:L domain-like protein n=1 Tax=Kwoniella dejecticola CBS 10117 TaxID=1296121 RepID=A0A1A5ZVL8_9TREE|nr:uncharacterized protein I303_07768 [Kwoniella dejecticola CBS 10117]OBR81858.1 hypothetical protein I303_07768 [Kwoniella dejecticola CBS 10117]